MAKKPDHAARIADNKKAAYNYFFEERLEAGIVLQGWEVKSLREGKVQLTDGYVVIRNGELFLIGSVNPRRSAPVDEDPADEARDAAERRVQQGSVSRQKRNREVSGIDVSFDEQI